MRHLLFPFTSAQRAALLAAVACFEQVLETTGGELPEDLESIATHDDEFQPVTADALSNLGLMLEQGVPVDGDLYRVPVTLYITAESAAAATLHAHSYLDYADEVANEPSDNEPHVESFDVQPAEPIAQETVAALVDNDAPLEPSDLLY